LTAHFPLYVTLSIAGLLLTVAFALYFHNARKRLPIPTAQIGNYTFEELYAELQGQTYNVQTMAMKLVGAKASEDNLLVLFMTYAEQMNQGITLHSSNDDSGYLYGVLCPKFESYGLVTKTILNKLESADVEILRYETSELGHKFYALVEKVNRRQKKNQGLILPPTKRIRQNDYTIKK